MYLGRPAKNIMFFSVKGQGGPLSFFGQKDFPLRSGGVREAVKNVLADFAR